jgi:hypothetical protein
VSAEGGESQRGRQREGKVMGEEEGEEEEEESGKCHAARRRAGPAKRR